MPAESRKQQRFMFAKLADQEKTGHNSTGMSASQLRDFTHLKKGSDPGGNSDRDLGPRARLLRDLPAGEMDMSHFISGGMDLQERSNTELKPVAYNNRGVMDGQLDQEKKRRYWRDDAKGGKRTSTMMEEY